MDSVIAAPTSLLESLLRPGPVGGEVPAGGAAACYKTGLATTREPAFRAAVDAADPPAAHDIAATAAGRPRDMSGHGAGAADGFEDFLRRQRDALLAFLRRRVDVDEAQDIVQDTCLRLMRYRDQAEHELRLLMYRIALNALHDRGRGAQSRQQAAHLSFEEMAEGLPTAEASHEQRVDDQQALARVREAILRLSPRCREIYLLNRIEGMSYTEIAAHCGVTVKAVEKQISKALLQLRLELDRPDNAKDRT